jgi:hypothetical protein
MRMASYVASMVQRTRVYVVWLGQPAGKRPLGRTRPRWEDSIGKDLQEFGWGFGLNGSGSGQG